MQPKGGDLSRSGDAAMEEIFEVDPFAPVRVRIHPLTRWTHDDEGRPAIEARLEFLDRWGHGVKALGVARFDFARAAGAGLTPAPGGSEAAVGGTLRTRWHEVDMRDPETNSTSLYDAVTRTYVITLLLESEREMEVPGALRILFTTEDGRGLTDERRLES